MDDRPAFCFEWLNMKRVVKGMIIATQFDQWRREI